MSRFSMSSRARVRLGQAIYRVEQNASKNGGPSVAGPAVAIETILKNICTLSSLFLPKDLTKFFQFSANEGQSM